MASFPAARILILDADGVLRRLPGGQTLEGLPALEALLAEPAFDDVLIVAAGEWKRALPLRRLRQLVSPALGARVVDAVPEVFFCDGYRAHVEINQWVAEHPEIADWVALESGRVSLARPALDSAVYVPLEEGVLGGTSLALLRSSLTTAAPLVAEPARLQ